MLTRAKRVWPSGPSAWAAVLRCRAGQQNEGRLCPPRQREYGRPATGPSGHRTPLVQRGDSMAQPCRGDCEAGGMIQLVFYCRVRRLAVNPSVGVRRQSLSRRSPTAPFAQGSRLCCSAHNHPFPWRWARIAKQPLPGDGLSHPEHRGRAAHKAFSEFWVQRHAGPVPGRPFLSLPDCAQPSLSVALGQDCKAAPTG